jgi:hypothetical protein
LKENLNFARPDLKSTSDSNDESSTNEMNAEQIENDFRNSGIQITTQDRLLSQRVRQIIRKKEIDLV